MNDVHSQISETLQKLKQERDELRVQVKLAKMEASDEWESIQSRLEKLEAKSKEIGSATADSAKDVGAAANLLAEELRDALKNIARHF